MHKCAEQNVFLPATEKTELWGLGNEMVLEFSRKHRYRKTSNNID
jgi:hypothetical protein